jgi:hypothetical protein
MHVFTLPIIILFCTLTPDCQLTKSFEAPFGKVKYTKNWNYFYADDTHTLMYYEENNFVRREEAEISFTYSPAPNKSYLRDTATLARRFETANAVNLKDMIGQKFPKVRIALDIAQETRVRMANTIWSKVVMTYSGIFRKKAQL